MYNRKLSAASCKLSAILCITANCLRALARGERGDSVKKFDEIIESYKEEFLSDLNELLSIQSVSALGSEVPEKALNWMLAKAESFGLKTKNIDNIAGHAEYGEGEILCGVLTHLDVVPAQKEGWLCEPFALTRKDGRLYGRGIADDKGAALAALYCLRALKECGVEGNKIRVIFGTSEEIGMNDMKVYFEHEQLPDLSFTPDSSYGICKAEKGIYHLEISSPFADNTVLNYFEAGSANNVVPDTAVAIVDCSEYEEDMIRRYINADHGRFELSYTIDGTKIVSRGTAAHACEPHKGFNAAGALALLLCNVFGYERVGSLCSYIDFCIGMETNGRSMGIKMRDSASGELTLTLSRVQIGADKARAVIDVRYPVTVMGDIVLYQIRKTAAREGLKVTVLDHEKPLFLDDTTPIVNILSNAYKTVTGSDAELYTTGGGTYARMLGGKGVAFGPVFPDDDCRMHNTNESLDEEKFFRHFHICMQSMHDMMKTEMR